MNCSSSLARDLCDTKPSRDFDLRGSGSGICGKPCGHISGRKMVCCSFLSWRIKLVTRIACCILLLGSSVFVWWHPVCTSTAICWIWSPIACTAKKTRPLAAGTLPIQTAMVAAIVRSWPRLPCPPADQRIRDNYFGILDARRTLQRAAETSFSSGFDALASLYSLRIEAGAQAAQVIASFWLLGFTMTLFFGLAAQACCRIKQINPCRSIAGASLHSRRSDGAYRAGHVRLCCSMLIFITACGWTGSIPLARRLWPIAGLLGGILFDLVVSATGGT